MQSNFGWWNLRWLGFLCQQHFFCAEEDLSVRADGSPSANDPDLRESTPFRRQTRENDYQKTQHANNNGSPAEVLVKLESEQNHFRRVLTAPDIALFIIASIASLQQLGAAAAIGPSVIGWWVITLVFYAVPFAMIASELGSAWPSQGGVYAWIKAAYGEHWASRTTWYYWASLCIWVPSMAILAASLLSQLFFPQQTLVEKIVIALVFNWVVVAIACLRTSIGKWLPSTGAGVKILILVGLGVVGLNAWFNDDLANDFSLSSLLPSYSEDLRYLPILVFSLSGFELVTGASGEIRNPEKTLPSALAIATFVVGFVYIFATFGILAVIPASEIVLDTGLIETLKIAFGPMAGSGVFVAAIGVAVIFSLLTTVIAWSMGINRTMQQAAAHGKMPPMLGIEHPSLLTPVGANVVMGILSTAIILAYSIMATSVEELFWTLIAFSTVIYLIPYIVVFAAFARLRVREPDQPRPFRVPGGSLGAKIVVALCMYFVIQTIVLFIITPGQPVDILYSSSIVIGCLVFIVIGEILLRWE